MSSDRLPHPWEIIKIKNIKKRNTPTPGNNENGHGEYSRHSGGEGEGGRVDEGSDTERVREDERIDIDKDEKTQGRNACKPDDESTGMQEEVTPHEEEEKTLHNRSEVLSE
jgi:hypothetical protein